MENSKSQCHVGQRKEIEGNAEHSEVTEDEENNIGTEAKPS